MELTAGIMELGVGLGCVGMAVAGWRRGGRAWAVVAALFALAGGVATAHAAVTLIR